ncbi:hypothetical protein MYP_340 [Sporocytophaga myxococcoides]|uniref:Uncharacterized protein n=1 Tax=Sporocytophaga myxococcoides TaxID=153721 RepID=A0A098L9N9_9BACT|nr:hypothetical protein MYP_340 [Sporocytophaga myxococcoides]
MKDCGDGLKQGGGRGKVWRWGLRALAMDLGRISLLVVFIEIRLWGILKCF